jgi:hypothetical protein
MQRFFFRSWLLSIKIQVDTYTSASCFKINSSTASINKHLLVRPSSDDWSLLMASGTRSYNPYTNILHTSAENTQTSKVVQRQHSSTQPLLTIDMHHNSSPSTRQYKLATMARSPAVSTIQTTALSFFFSWLRVWRVSPCFYLSSDCWSWYTRKNKINEMNQRASGRSVCAPEKDRGRGQDVAVKNLGA